MARKSRYLATLNRELPICHAFRKTRDPYTDWAQSLREGDLQFIPPILRFTLEGAMS